MDQSILSPLASVSFPSLLSLPTPLSPPLSLSLSLSPLALSPSVSPFPSLSLLWMSFCKTPLYCCILLRIREIFSHNHKKGSKYSFHPTGAFTYSFIFLTFLSTWFFGPERVQDDCISQSPSPNFLSARVTASNGLSTPSSWSLGASLSLAVVKFSLVTDVCFPQKALERSTIGIHTIICLPSLSPISLDFETEFLLRS